MSVYPVFFMWISDCEIYNYVENVAIMKERLTNAKYSCKILIYCGGKVK